MKALKVTLLTISLSVFASHVNGSTADKVGDWFDNMNYSNITKPGVYEGQSARYVTLGGVSTRAPITQPFDFVNIQTPKFSAGCGGIDFYAGGFSAVDADQFVNNLRAIGQNAQSLAFMLAIQVVSPQLSGIMEKVQNWANKYLKMGMDSCQAASGLVGGALEFFDKEKANCIASRRSQHGEDYVTASYACTTGAQKNSTVGSDSDVNEVDFVRGNLAWYVLMQDTFFSNDTQFAELVMNITGTLIAELEVPSDPESALDISYIEPAIKDAVVKERFNNIYNALLHGDQTNTNLSIYRCQPISSSPDGCKTISTNLQQVNPDWTGLYQRVEEMVNSIAGKVYTDTALTEEEKGLISSTSIPLYRFLSAATTYYPSSMDISGVLGEFSEFIAQDILLGSISAVIQKLEQRSSMLKKGMSQAQKVKEYRADLHGVLNGLAILRKDNEYSAEKLVLMQQRIATYERALLPKIGEGIVTASMWQAK